MGDKQTSTVWQRTDNYSLDDKRTSMYKLSCFLLFTDRKREKSAKAQVSLQVSNNCIFLI